VTDTEFMPRSDAQILDEYYKLCRNYGYPPGTPLERLMVHEHLQGAQALELEPDVNRLRRELVRTLALRGVS
jgi:hypothetical protein